MSWLDVIVSLSSICNDGEDEDDGDIPDVLLIGAVEHRNMHCCAYKSTVHTVVLVDNVRAAG